MEDNYIEEKNRDSFLDKLGYRIGAMFAYTLAGCVTAIVVALTVKFVMWILC